MSKPNDARPLKKQRTIPITPTGRWGGSLNVISDDSLFLYGGESDEGFGKALGTTHLFSVSQQLWTVPTTSVTSTRVWHTTTTLPSLNALFIFGGESYDLEAPEILSSPMLYDLDNKLYYPPTLGRGKGPSKRSGHSACLINDDIVIFGGIARRSWLGDRDDHRFDHHPLMSKFYHCWFDRTQTQSRYNLASSKSKGIGA